MFRSVTCVGILALIVGLGVTWAEQTWVHPCAVPQAGENPNEVLVVIEITQKGPDGVSHRALRVCARGAR